MKAPRGFKISLWSLLFYFSNSPFFAKKRNKYTFKRRVSYGKKGYHLDALLRSDLHLDWLGLCTNCEAWGNENDQGFKWRRGL
jgi:hypothetical protein